MTVTQPSDHDAQTPVLVADGISKHYGGVPAADSVYLSIAPGMVHALIGPNGAGKSTTVGMVSGATRPDAGRVLLGGTDVSHLPPHKRAALGMARSFQITSIFPELTALDNAILAVTARRRQTWRIWAPVRRDTDLRDAGMALLERVGLAEVAEDRASGVMAHGQKRALELAMALAGTPRLLLLDEPMAGMGPEESQQMIGLLESLKGSLAILLVEHDMDAVFALADQVTVMVNGQVIACDTPDRVRADDQVRAAYLGEEGMHG